MTAARITQFVHSRSMLFIMAIVMVAGAVFAFMQGKVDYVQGDRGIVFASSNLWIADHVVEMWVNIAGTLGIAVLITALNRSYNLLKTISLLDSSLFLAMSLATPWLLTQFYTGTPLCIILIVCTFLLYSTFGGGPETAQRIFLIFFILSGMTMTQYCYAVYIPVFIIGCWQMRVANGRVFVAMLLGLITPWWIVLGSGLVESSSVHIPRFADLFGSFDFLSNIKLFVSVALTALLLVTSWVMNFPRMIAYNAHNRAFNGTLSVLSLVTLVAVACDFTNISVYAPVLYVCSAIYTGRWFALHKIPSSYIGILTIFLLYFLLYAWSIV